jgi:spore coat protein A, manganese oxidase
MWTYGGTFPGSTIRRPAGHRTSVTFHHRLPPAAGELTVHLHGGHNSSADDGQPGGLTPAQQHAFYCDVSPKLSPAQSGNDLLIAPGASRTYVYDLVEDGAPERAAFQWYHDHRLERTSRNVWRGLAGMWIIDDELDASLPLPKGDRDIPLLIADRSFDRHNQLTDPFRHPAPVPGDAVSGRRALVNGAWRPHQHVHAQRYRLRVLNASGFRTYNLHRSDGEPFVQIGSDSGLMPRPARRRHVLLGPGERAELIVDFHGAAGRRVELLSEPAGAPRIAGARPFHGALMEFRVGRRLRDRTEIPARLRPLPRLVRDAPRNPSRRWVLSVSGGFVRHWTINGKTFDPARSDAFPVLGTTETWEIVNNSGVAHVIHMHSTDWYLLARNGAPPPPWERCLKESFLIRPHETIHVAAYFSDHAGKFVMHCHMLDHEDHGLMAQFELVPPLVSA